MAIAELRVRSASALGRVALIESAWVRLSVPAKLEVASILDIKGLAYDASHIAVAIPAAMKRVSYPTSWLLNNKLGKLPD